MSTVKFSPSEAQFLYGRLQEVAKTQRLVSDKYDQHSSRDFQRVIAGLEEDLMDICMSLSMRLDEAVAVEARPARSWLQEFEGHSYSS